MDTKSFEVLIHSQYAFDVCRPQVQNFEDCRQTGISNTNNPLNCRQQARSVVGCYREAEKMHPLCVAPFNDSRECLFKSDGVLNNCREFMEQYVHCQKDQADYQDFLSASTNLQRKALQFDFTRYRGHYDKTMS